MNVEMLITDIVGETDNDKEMENADADARVKESPGTAAGAGSSSVSGGSSPSASAGPAGGGFGVSASSSPSASPSEIDREREQLQEAAPPKRRAHLGVPPLQLERRVDRKTVQKQADGALRSVCLELMLHELDTWRVCRWPDSAVHQTLIEQRPRPAARGRRSARLRGFVSLEPLGRGLNGEMRPGRFALSLKQHDARLSSWIGFGFRLQIE